ncbi:hypothetical protein XU18_3872 [Perkinsela sp. CCAP 1560/4]|nr:hypothetical protein XU18_3872 [Perkinsela sp. CCAP 1560/4]|eukprot:KNH04998.1 hypothetical protein XU18_3872 [Perkinsela sp. CCAP 1560/4]
MFHSDISPEGMHIISADYVRDDDCQRWKRIGCRNGAVMKINYNDFAHVACTLMWDYSNCSLHLNHDWQPRPQQPPSGNIYISVISEITLMNNLPSASLRY